ncbi:hypothetical protein [Fluviicola taffensis]|uniref:Lipoprotein n=1 Tax=Fluviicola taffensis (strain DSM 16823 / NCIMB 13979 / RW262) TaxID=755732 RepID=F2IDK7_FLUTR|nr:hypothetical protein [Fluviicola taffensis]AEA43380.1 hypothetical protein Fluta_1386 [Fluviicola taffensis DSM 16823]
MKNKFLIILAIAQVIFFSSCNLKETSILDKSLKTTIDENSCLIALKSTSDNNKRNVVLTTQCESDSILFYGKVLYDFVSNLSKEGVHFDNYSIQNISNQELVSFDKNEWIIISAKRKIFDKIVDELQTKNYKKMYALLSTEIKSKISYEDMKSNVKTLLKSKYNKFEGLSLMSVNGEKYISLSRTNGKNRILITFSFEKSNDKVYGYSLE